MSQVELARHGVGVLPAATLPKSSARATSLRLRVSHLGGLRVRQGTWPPSPLPCLRSLAGATAFERSAERPAGPRRRRRLASEIPRESELRPRVEETCRDRRRGSGCERGERGVLHAR